MTRPVLRLSLTCLVPCLFRVSRCSFIDIQNGQDNLLRQVESHPDVVDKFFPNRQTEEIYNKYRVSFPNPEHFSIELIVNPCGFNVTDYEENLYVPHGYDCCMNHFGRGEYGYMKYDPSFLNGTVAMDFATASNKRILAGPSEVSHNMYLVDEFGTKIDYADSRRADDFHIIDDSCEGLRLPDSSCSQSRIRAIASPSVPPCWDHNQTVHALRHCFSVDGVLLSHCMQVGYVQNAYIHVCGGSFADNDRCGTFIEIHMPNGNPYDNEETVLSEIKLTTRETNGMYTTTIRLLYKANPNHVLCAYEETRIRIGSMVKILELSPTCCCPPKYSEATKTGSFFCPIKRNTRSGPFADFIHTITEKLQKDIDMSVYPYCGAITDDEDVLMCSRETNGWLPKHLKIDPRSGKEYMGSGYFYSLPCDPIKGNYSRVNALLLDSFSQLGSDRLEGIYTEPCPFGPAFQSCTGSHHGCLGNDSPFTFTGEIGKVLSISQRSDPKQTLYRVTFNNGRTSYDFPQYMLEIQKPIANYELWFVQRNRFEKILQKRKGFLVQGPTCTFDILKDQYLPYAILQDGNVLTMINFTAVQSLN